jgi:hypothetical protein
MLLQLLLQLAPTIAFEGPYPGLVTSAVTSAVDFAVLSAVDSVVLFAVDSEVGCAVGVFGLQCISIRAPHSLSHLYVNGSAVAAAVGPHDCFLRPLPRVGNFCGHLCCRFCSHLCYRFCSHLCCRFCSPLCCRFYSPLCCRFCSRLCCRFCNPLCCRFCSWLCSWSVRSPVHINKSASFTVTSPEVEQDGRDAGHGKALKC